MLATFAAALIAAASAHADTLILRDGRRVTGELVAIRDGVIEFDGEAGLFGRRDRLRIDRREVLGIEFEDTSRDRFDRDDRGRDRDDRGLASRPSGMRERDVTVNAS